MLTIIRKQLLIKTYSLSIYGAAMRGVG